MKKHTGFTLKVLMVLFFFSGLVQAGKVNKWVDSAGNVSYSEKRPASGDFIVLTLKAAPKVNAATSGKVNSNACDKASSIVEALSKSILKINIIGDDGRKRPMTAQEREEKFAKHKILKKKHCAPI